MKKNIMNFLLSGIVFVFACSFVEGPMVPAAAPQTASTMDETPFGGAFLRFADKFGGEITRKEIAEHQNLTVDGCAKGSRIYQFTLDITKSGKLTTLQAESNVLSKDMLTKLKSLSPGDFFEFRKTKAYLPDSKDAVDVHAKKFVVVS